MSREKLLVCPAGVHFHFEGIGVGEHLPADAAPLLRDAAYFLSLLIDLKRVGTKYRAAHFRNYSAGCVH